MRKLFVLLVASALALTGCVPSIHSFYRNKDVYFDARLVGTWTDDEDKEQWQFARKDDVSYRVKYVDGEGKAGHFTAHLFRIEGREFLDLSPVRADASDRDVYVESYLPTHMLVSVKVESGRAQLSFLDPVWLKDFLKQNPSEIDHTVVEQEVILTGTTARLQSFVRRHIRTRGAFGEMETMFKKGDK